MIDPDGRYGARTMEGFNMNYRCNPSAKARGKNLLRRMTAATLALAAAALLASPANAQTGYIGILGGGPVYKRNRHQYQGTEEGRLQRAHRVERRGGRHWRSEPQRRIPADVERRIYRRPNLAPISRTTSRTSNRGKSRASHSASARRMSAISSTSRRWSIPRGRARRASCTRISLHWPRLCRSMRSI